MSIEATRAPPSEGKGGYAGGPLWVVNHDSPEHIASLRYMALIPARARHEPVARFLAGMDAEMFLDQLRPTALVLTKAFDSSIITLARAAQRRSIRIIAVLCDDRSARPEAQFLDRALVALADDLVVQTEAMSKHVRGTYGRDSAIVEEPYEMPAGLPRFDPGDTINLLWYGRFTNHDTLGPGILPLVDDASLNFKLTVVTDMMSEQLATLAQQMNSRRGAAIEVRGWTLEHQAEALEQADLVVIPSLDRQDKWVKGHNRLVESIRAGVPAIAYPLPAYRELSEFCWCGDDLRAGLGWAMAHREILVERVRQGQSYIERRFSIASVNARWQRLFDAVRPVGSHG